MSKSITIQDKDYLQWVKELGSLRERQSHINRIQRSQKQLSESVFRLSASAIRLHLQSRVVGVLPERGNGEAIIRKDGKSLTPFVREDVRYVYLMTPTPAAGLIYIFFRLLLFK